MLGNKKPILFFLLPISMVLVLACHGGNLSLKDCLEGDVRCKGNNVQVCDGGEWVIQDNCLNLGKVCLDGFCVAAQATTDGDGYTDGDVDRDADGSLDGDADGDSDGTADGDSDADQDPDTDQDPEIENMLELNMVGGFGPCLLPGYETGIQIAGGMAFWPFIHKME